MTNRIDRVIIAAYVYDAFNRLKQVVRKDVSSSSSSSRSSADAIVAEYVYDAMGRRIRKTITNGGLAGTITDGETNFLYDGQQCIEERDETETPLRQYVWGGYIDELIQQRELDGGSDDLYPLSDLLYRTAALTDDTGSIMETYDTSAYGETLIFDDSGADTTWFTDDDVTADEPTCPFIFTGRRYDPETELYFYRARSYNPTLGRFLQRDPAKYIDGMSLYEYAASKPVTAVDPDGKAITIVIGGTAIVIGAVDAAALAMGITVAACLVSEECLELAAKLGQDISERAINNAKGLANQAIETVKSKCPKVRCKTELHPPHHRFPTPRFELPPWKMCWKWHIQVNCWVEGWGKIFELRIPFGPCYKFKHGQGGITY